MASIGELPNEEYEAQFLGFTPTFFLGSVEKVISDRLSEALDQLEQHLSQVQDDIVPASEIVSGMATLRQDTDKHYSKTINKFKSHIRKVLEVPLEVLHPDDKDQAYPATASDITIMQAEIENLHLQLRNEKFMHAKYRDELKEIGTVLKEQDRFLSTTVSSTVMASVDQVREQLEFIHTNLDEIKAAGVEADLAIANLPTDCNLTPTDLQAQDIFHTDK